MKRTLLAATMALLLWGMPAMGGPLPDFDGDGVSDVSDNCSDVSNAEQIDSDGDDCGNSCDTDYNDSGLVTFLDFSSFVAAFGTLDLEKDHTLPMTGPVKFLDFSFFLANFGSVPGPSGTTSGTTACP
jgi:hypothetical protein